MGEIYLPGGYSVQEGQRAAGWSHCHMSGQNQSVPVVRNVGRYSCSALPAEVGLGSQRLTSWQKPCGFPGLTVSFPPLLLLSASLLLPPLPPLCPFHCGVSHRRARGENNLLDSLCPSPSSKAHQHADFPPPSTVDQTLRVSYDAMCRLAPEQLSQST